VRDEGEERAESDDSEDGEEEDGWVWVRQEEIDEWHVA